MSKDNYLVVCKCLLDVVSLREDMLIPVPMVLECNNEIENFCN